MLDITFRRTLLGILNIKYLLEVKTGLIVRYPLSKARIGGADTMPMTAKIKYIIDEDIVEIEVPYIPGSSLKGRMRGLMELKEGLELFSQGGKIFQHYLPSPDKKFEAFEKYVSEPLDHTYGYPALHFIDVVKAIEKKKKLKREEAEEEAKKIFDKLAITRLIVYDLFPSTKYVKELYMEKKNVGLSVMLDDFLEDKPENRIDRVTSAADPRLILRVKPGVEFEGLMSLLIFDADLDASWLKRVLEKVFVGLKLVEDTYLGGSGSRGYGRVCFKDFKLVLKTRSYYQNLSETESIGEYPSVDDIIKSLDKIVDKIVKKLSAESSK